MKRYNPFIRLTIILLFFLLGALCLTANVASAQSITQKTINVSWSVENVEEDIAAYQLYAGDTNDAAALQPVGERILFNPLDNPNSLTRLSTDYVLEAPEGQVTYKYFAVTAIDTSGNESNLSSISGAVVDNEPPAPPSGFRVEVQIPVINTPTQ